MYYSSCCYSCWYHYLFCPKTLYKISYMFQSDMNRTSSNTAGVSLFCHSEATKYPSFPC